MHWQTAGVFAIDQPRMKTIIVIVNPARTPLTAAKSDNTFRQLYPDKLADSMTYSDNSNCFLFGMPGGLFHVFMFISPIGLFPWRLVWRRTSLDLGLISSLSEPFHPRSTTLKSHKVLRASAALSIAVTAQLS
jgi:hypothetical protein